MNPSGSDTPPYKPEFVEDAQVDTVAPAETEVSVEERITLPPPALPKRPAPVGEAERLQTLDVVRGIAVYGILFVNIQDFAMVQEARYDPALSGGGGPLNHLIWLFTFLFCDTKFLAIFTMLFGAGIAVMNSRRRGRNQRGTWKVYYRRMVFLLGLGVAHGLFLWRGDILYFYAIGGLILYLAPRLPTTLLSLGGLGLFAWHVQRFSDQLYKMRINYSWWEREIYRGTWSEQFQFRREFEMYYLKDVPLEFAPHLIGLMLLGMALYKSGFLGGKWPKWLYAGIAVIGLTAGFGMVSNAVEFSLTALVREWGEAFGRSGGRGGVWSRFESLDAAKMFLWGSLLLAFGYMATAMLLTLQFGKWLPLRAMASVGRMALTNYLTHSIICTTIFYGYGFGLYERTERAEQLVLVLSIFAFQLIFSHLWLKVFRFGPFEWVWRTFSYWKWQPMLQRRIEEPPPRPVTL